METQTFLFLRGPNLWAYSSVIEARVDLATPEQLANALERLASFTSDLEHSPTRFNAFTVREATVGVVFGHNVDSLRAVIAAHLADPTVELLKAYLKGPGGAEG